MESAKMLAEGVPFFVRTPSQPTINRMFDTMWDPWRESAGFRELIAKLGNRV